MKKVVLALILVVVSFMAFNMLVASAQMGSGMMRPGSGTGWGVGAFHSNGERIYFTSTSNRGTEITYTGGLLTGDG